MPDPAAPLRFLLLLFAGIVNREQAKAIDFLREENRVLREQLRGQRLRLTDDQRRRLAAKGKALGRAVLEDYSRLQGALRHLGHVVARTTIANILKANGIQPAPERPTSWRTFLENARVSVLGQHGRVPVGPASEFARVRPVRQVGERTRCWRWS